MVINHDAFKVMKRWTADYNVGWILNSMRHDELMEEPLRTLEKESVKLYSLRKNPRQGLDDNEVNKCFAIMSIDDRNLGVPLKWLDGCNRPHVDWEKVDEIGSPILDYISKQLLKVKNV